MIVRNEQSTGPARNDLQRCLSVSTVFICLVLAANLRVAGAQEKKSEPAVPSVVVAEVVARDVTPTFEQAGRVEATDVVDLRARVQGFLEKRNFREGTFINKGDLLFVIEKAPYQVIVDQRRADLAGAQASLKKAELELDRKATLQKQAVASKADLDLATAEAGTARARVLQAEAALREAELNLSYTEIRSPISGQVSRAKYSVGNLVRSSSEPLAKVTSVDPIYVTIAITEKVLIEARKEGIDLENPPVAPFLILGDGSKYQHHGEFDFLDTEVKQSTDTVTARTVFPNPKRVLIPGQYVKVIVKRKKPLSALVVPQVSVQSDQKGPFVLVVNRANKVELRYIRTGNRDNSDWIVESGLSEGERVIVQGIQKVRPDMPVNAVIAQGS